MFCCYCCVCLKKIGVFIVKGRSSTRIPGKSSFEEGQHWPLPNTHTHTEGPCVSDNTPGYPHAVTFPLIFSCPKNKSPNPSHFRSAKRFVEMDILRQVSDTFWSKSVWLPPNTTWADIAPGSRPDVQHANYQDLIWPLPIALLLIVLRHFVEK